MFDYVLIVDGTSIRQERIHNNVDEVTRSSIDLGYVTSETFYHTCLHECFSYVHKCSTSYAQMPSISSL
jgi:hypothetical protein